MPKRALASLVDVDPESIPGSASPDLEFLYVDIASVSEGRVKLPDHRIRLKEAPSRARRVIRSGDVLMSTVRPNLKAFAHCELPSDFCVASTGFAVLRARDTNDPRYVLYSILSDETTRQIDRLVAGSSYPAITSSDVKRLLIPDFGPHQQRAIAEVLSTMDETIQQTVVLISKLQHVKTGMMHDLFSRGVTCDGDLRPTYTDIPQLYGETALGWIPKDWDLMPLRDWAAFITSGSRGWADYYAEEGPIFIRIGNLTREHVNLRLDDTVRVMPPRAAEGSRTATAPGDILISITADLGLVGTIESRLGEAYVNQHVALVRPKKCGFSRFVAHCLSSQVGQKQFSKANESGAKAGINLPTVGRMFIVWPKHDKERAWISDALDSVDAAIASARDEYAKLQAVKRGLMHDLLTGQVPADA